MTEDWLKKYTQYLLRKYKVNKHFGVQIVNCESYYGVCKATNHILNKKHNTIKISTSCLDYDKHFCKEVILHEIAHAIDFIQNGFKWRVKNIKNNKVIHTFHDKKFKNICKLIGNKEFL